MGSPGFALEEERSPSRRFYFSVPSFRALSVIFSQSQSFFVSLRANAKNRKCLEEAGRKLAMTQVELDRTNEKANEAESKIQELEEQMNVVGQNMKTLELSETNALKRHEDYEEKSRDLTLNLKFTEIQAAAAEREATKLQKELDALTEELNDWKERYQ